MSAARLNIHGGHGLDRHSFAVKFDVSFALQHEVNLGRPLVVMQSRIMLDFDLVQAGYGVRSSDEWQRV